MSWTLSPARHGVRKYGVIFVAAIYPKATNVSKNAVERVIDVLKQFCILMPKSINICPRNLELERTKFGSVFWENCIEIFLYVTIQYNNQTYDNTSERVRLDIPQTQSNVATRLANGYYRRL